MRVLWLSPWMRPLARIYIERLHQAGHQCLLITSDRHYEQVRRREWERVLDPRPKDPRTWRPLAATLREARTFRPDVVVAELVQDPRWWAFGWLAPVVHLVHDDRPHDDTEQQPRWRRALAARWRRRSTRVVVFSHYVASELARLGQRSDVVPLTSDVSGDMIPVRTGPRRDFVLFGRLAPYKNIPIAFESWRAHHRSAHYRGDRFLILGDGPPGWAGPGGLPEGCEWRRGRFAYQDVLPVLSAAKGSLVHYRSASQSGVQLLSMQLGVATVVSNCGGLPEFQPPGNDPLDVDDAEGLTAWFDALADPAEADRRGRQCGAHFNQFYAAERSVEALETVLRRAAEPR